VGTYSALYLFNFLLVSYVLSVVYYSNNKGVRNDRDNFNGRFNLVTWFNVFSSLFINGGEINGSNVLDDNSSFSMDGVSFI
jgi:hypothetical protein